MRSTSSVSFFLVMLLSVVTAFAQPSYRFRHQQTQTGDDIEEIKDKLLLLQGKTGRTNDSLRLELLNSLSVQFIRKSKDSALFYANKALVEAKAIDLKNLIAVSLYNIGSTYEYYKQPDLAEQNYLAWMEVRKKQNDDEYRWTLHKLRFFYIENKMPDKLAHIQEEWMLTLDRQLAKGEITPWYEYDSATPEDSYKYSTIPTFYYLITSGNYFIAEKSFLHMMDKCPTCCSDWTDEETPYVKSQLQMLQNADTANLSLLYDHWYKALEKYKPGNDVMLEVFQTSASFYVISYYQYDNYFDQYYPLMMKYTYNVGGDNAVHELLKTSLTDTYGTKFIVKIKLNLFLLQSCLKVKDKDRLEKTYTELDRLVSGYLSNRNSRSVLKNLLIEARSKSEDKRFIKWCDDQIIDL